MASTKLTWRFTGFTLIEIVLALFTGLALMTLILQALLVDSGAARRLGRLVRERLNARRAMVLIRSEMQQSLSIKLTASARDHPGCGLSGRQVKLHLHMPAGKITYSIEQKPASIWRGQALMRCGPTYGLDGTLNAETNESRVLLDGLREGGFSVAAESDSYSLSIVREFKEPNGTLDKTDLSERVAAPMLK